MGREAVCPCTLNGVGGEVKALLESDALTLRGAFKRRYALAALAAVRVDGAWLRFEAGGEAVALELGAQAAASWATKIATPPPTLAEKLGIDAAHRAYVLAGDPQRDAALAEALRSAQAARAGEALIGIAIVFREAELTAAVAAHAGMPQSRYLWVVHPKGRDASLGDAEVRRLMLAQGYVDSKTSAVSAALTATRYGRR
ncbi:MAG: hypothetical protein IV097_04665 [Burkholderiaceae bacterium]|nr:hypothetical protein [Burkholderiaceae bacterium]